MRTYALPRIPFADLRVAREDVDVVAATVRHGLLGLGPRTEAVEREFAQRIGVRHAVALSSSTAALHLAYLAAGIGPGDEVIVSPLAAATVNAAIYCGAEPVFADIIGQHDLSLDPADVERRIGPRTRAVAAVHLAGYGAPVHELAAICERHEIALIEDASHAPDTVVGGHRAGTVGSIGVFSFSSNAVFASGEGALLATDDALVAKLARRRRSPSVVAAAWSRCVDAVGGMRAGAPGFDHRFDEPRAALLQARLTRLDDELAQRRALVRRYRDALVGLPGLSLPYAQTEISAASCYAMPVMLEEPERRRGFRRRLHERHGVQTRVLQPSVHWLGGAGEPWLPRAEHALATEVTLPLYPQLSRADQDRVIAAVDEALRA